MKKISIISLIILGALALWAWKPKTIVSFSSTTWESAKERAIQESKLYFVDFDASYCATCRNMDESTYMDGRLAQYMEQNVVALRMDVQDFDGVMWSQQYEVEALPTMLIFNEKGDLVKRLVGYQSAADLLKTFQSVQAAVASTSTPKSNPEIAPATPDEPMARANTNEKVNNDSYIKNYLEAEAPSPKTLGIYEVAVQKQSSKGYSVQVGVYSSYDAILDQAERMRKRFNTKTLIQITETQGNVMYKLMMGQFESRRDAMIFRRTLKEKGQDGLVKDLSVIG